MGRRTPNERELLFIFGPLTKTVVAAARGDGAGAGGEG